MKNKYTVQTSRGPVRFHSVGEPIEGIPSAPTPLAWMRKYCADKLPAPMVKSPHSSRMVLGPQAKFHAVTEQQIFPDDVPLYRDTAVNADLVAFVKHAERDWISQGNGMVPSPLAKLAKKIIETHGIK